MELTVSMSEQGQLIWIWLSVRKDGLSQSIFLTILFLAGHVLQFIRAEKSHCKTNRTVVS